MRPDGGAGLGCTAGAACGYGTGVGTAAVTAAGEVHGFPAALASFIGIDSLVIQFLIFAGVSFAGIAKRILRLIQNGDKSLLTGLGSSLKL